MRHAVLGTGGVGGLLAGALARAGDDVTLLLRPDALAAYPGALVETARSTGARTMEVPMTDKTDYEPGQPIWVDLGTPDLDATIEFYGRLFGWTCEKGPAEFGGYNNFFKDGKRVAGVMPLMPGQHSVWTSYFCSHDSDATTAAVEAAGGVVHARPMEVGDLGRMAVFGDPAGAAFGTWQPGRHTGAELVDEEGTYSWTELSTRDQAAALPFYAAVFGWHADVQPDYTQFELGETQLAGAMDMPAAVPAEIPSYWMPYFAAKDPAAKAQEAVALGATMRVPFLEMDQVALSVVADPHGSQFGLLHLKS